MNIKLDSLTLTNFKGIKYFATGFEQQTDIHGDNATGKTTIFDAFTWLLFGKDSTDRKDFEIKTLDEHNNVIPKIEHEVSGTIDVGGVKTRLTKTFKEKWVKKRGADIAEFTGNETIYKWNDVPKTAGEYQEKITEILDEEMFKLVSNPLQFNSISWQTRRKILMGIAGNIAVDDILAEMDGDFPALREALNEGKTIEEFKKQMQAERKRVNDQLLLIPTRIDEATRAMPEAVDYEAVQSERDLLVAELAGIDRQLLDSSEAAKAHFDRLSLKQKALFELNSKVSERVNAITTHSNIQRSETQNRIDTVQAELTRTIAEVAPTALNRVKSRLAESTNSLNQLRAQWTTEDAKELVFAEDEFECPACKRPLADIDSKRDQLTEQFNLRKSATLDKMMKDAAELKVTIAKLEAELSGEADRQEGLNKKILDLQNEIRGLNSAKDKLAQGLQEALKNDAALLELDLTVNALKTDIEKTKADSGLDQSALDNKKFALSAQISLANLRLGSKEQTENIKARILQLQAEEKELAQAVSDTDRKLFHVEQFIKTQTTIIERQINGKFSFVKFRLYRKQINGGEEECCDTLVDGVPYSDLNNAMKVNCGIDIINTLSERYGLTTPIFIDNAESVVQLTPTNSQLIRLVVDGSAAKLTVKAPSATPKQEKLFA